MFDSDPKTFWHSQRKMEKDLKIIGVQFKVSCLQFLSLKNSFIFSNEMVLYMKDIEHDYWIKEPIEFFSLTIQKRLDCCHLRYKNVCLVIDNNIANQICTDSFTGFNGQNGDEITWTYASKGKYFHTSETSTILLIFLINEISCFSKQIIKLLTDTNSKSTIAQRIDLYFRDTEHAQIADLQIKFKRTGEFSTKNSRSRHCYT